MTTDGIVKFSDFGIAEQFDLYNQDDMISSEFAGTHQFLPPEIAEGQSSFEATGVDIWALGVTLYNMLTGNYPFEFSTEKNILELYDKIINGEYEMPINIDEEGRSLISGMLEKNYEKRSNIFQIINHPWTKSIQHENPRSSTVSVPMNDTSDEKTRMMPIIETLFSQELSEFYNVDGTLEAQFRKQDNYLDGLPVFFN